MVDVLLLCFLGLQVAVTLPYESVTSSLRRIVLLFIDVALPYFVLSRACRSREMITEAMAAFVMATVLLAPLAVFEFLKGWMLYAGAQDEWNAGHMFYPLYRGGFMRAITTAGHSINLGYFMAIGFGMWLYLRNRLNSYAWRWLGFATLLTGLTVTLARGTWIGAGVIFGVYLMAGPRAAKRSVQGFAIVGALCGLVLLSPWRAQIVDYLPFVGTIDADTIAMRQSLAEGSWQLIQQHPLFGSPSFLAYMEQFRTGEGIIDLVNTYATLALSFGLIGMALFLSVFVTLVWQTHREVRAAADADPDSALMGAALIACIVGTLVVIATTSFQLALPSMTWALAALAAAYVRLPAHSPANEAEQFVAVRVS
jgi:O-antigen ligase